MRKLYEIFKVLKVQKRIVSTETICGITVFFLLQNAAALECLDLIHFDQVQCMWDLIEADFQCIICFCEVIEEVGAIFGQEWSCDV